MLNWSLNNLIFFYYFESDFFLGMEGLFEVVKIIMDFDELCGREFCVFFFGDFLYMRRSKKKLFIILFCDDFLFVLVFFRNFMFKI